MSGTDTKAEALDLAPANIVLYRSTPSNEPWMTSVVAVRPNGRHVIVLDGGEDGPFEVTRFENIELVNPRDLVAEVRRLRDMESRVRDVLARAEAGNLMSVTGALRRALSGEGSDRG